MKNRRDLESFQCHRSMTASSFSKMLFPFLCRHSKRKKNVATEGVESKFKILSLSSQIYSPAAFVLSRVQLKLNTEGQILPLRITQRFFFFSKLNSVLVWENFLAPKLKQYSQNHFHFCATGVNMTKLESLTWSQR